MDTVPVREGSAVKMQWLILCVGLFLGDAELMSAMGADPLPGYDPMNWIGYAVLQHDLQDLCDGKIYDHGWTPLHIAAIDGNERLVKFLLAAGADVCAFDNNGRRPADCALENNNFALAYFLKEEERKKLCEA